MDGMGIWGWGGRYGDSGTGTHWRLGRGLAEGCGSVAGGETFLLLFPFVPGCLSPFHLGQDYNSVGFGWDWLL